MNKREEFLRFSISIAASRGTQFIAGSDQCIVVGRGILGIGMGRHLKICEYMPDLCRPLSIFPSRCT